MFIYDGLYKGYLSEIIEYQVLRLTLQKYLSIVVQIQSSICSSNYSRILSDTLTYNYKGSEGEVEQQEEMEEEDIYYAGFWL